ncbi:hypothetical protein SAMN02982927_03427 [Sporolactobacillus nakayamae]|uniref:Uncharacterized protein n=1 Tax=Sporolactobacillus nakayamae TaxID=269670 RepID=A0A1I2W6K9_9BACL|nr:hypothetical protein SAMN02982927_03427 [Sporolactobacillus nakayamae]
MNDIINLVIFIFIFIFCGVVLFQLLRVLSKDLDFIQLITKFIKSLFKSKH